MPLSTAFERFFRPRGAYAARFLREPSLRLQNAGAEAGHRLDKWFRFGAMRYN